MERIRADSTADDESLRRMIDFVATEPVPTMAPDTWEHIVARRSAGERGVRPLPTRRLAAAAMAAAALIVFVIARQGDNDMSGLTSRSACLPAATPTGEDFMQSSAFHRYVLAASPLPLALALGCAETSPVASLTPAPALLADRVNGERLVPAVLSYRTVASGETAADMHNISISRSNWGGDATWMIVSWSEVASGNVRRGGDTLQVDRVTLTPLAVYRRPTAESRSWGYYADRKGGRLDMSLQTPDGRIAERGNAFPKNEPVPAPYLPAILFRALDVTDGFTASFETFHPSRAFVAPFIRRNDNWTGRAVAHVRVVGEERVTVPAGSFDSWKAIVDRRWMAPTEVSIAPEEIWISKNGGWIVRTATRPDGGAEARVSELVSIRLR
jgi:hypothetical protein